ncbi:hypothetical protein PPGU19_072000 (plasmid) [Paraburkholderia sp. PGU19]|uniref:hypothetical protein n=1 Tax=Paraburkholderia sp. PGU19 TaxID=2735434 RepID=UPI0015DCFFBF|nr:hypothetical protein [Paraburkholderia sp. PGU19]BCG02632.1 hypothetical protein PPGU19_072000 [Paraburkholderia sp. PGU19]
MLELLAEKKRRFEAILEGRGNLPAVIFTYMDQKAATYAASYRDEWRRRGEGVRSYFRDWNIERIDASTVEDFLLNNWPEKLPTQKAMKAWLSTFFSWAVRKK